MLSSFYVCARTAFLPATGTEGFSGTQCNGGHQEPFISQQFFLLAILIWNFQEKYPPSALEDFSPVFSAESANWSVLIKGTPPISSFILQFSAKVSPWSPHLDCVQTALFGFQMSLLTNIFISTPWGPSLMYL